MDTLGDLFSRETRSDRAALHAPGDPPATYDYRAFVETAWKAGNYFRRLGAHEGATVAIEGETAATVVLSTFGATLNGALARLAPPGQVDAKLLVAPGDRIEAFDLPAGAQRIAYDGEVGDPAVHDFGEGVWSENPFFPERDLDSDVGAVADGTRRYTHGEAVAAIEGVGERIDPDEEVVVRAGVDDARTLLGGVLAPLASGASARIAGRGTDHPGDVAIVDRESGEVPEGRTIEVESIEGSAE